MTRRSQGPPRGQSSSSQPLVDPRVRGKGPAIDESEGEDGSSQAGSGSGYDSDSVIPDRSDDVMVDPEEPEIDLKLISADDYAILRQRDQYLLPSNSINPRFHTKFQEQIYEQAYGQNRKFAYHKWID